MNKNPDHHYKSSMEDDDLVRSFQAGNEQAFDELVLRHKDKIFNLCYWFLQDYQDANEQAQETFIKTFKALKKFRFESSFSTWLHRITVNTCKNRIKSLEYRFRKKTDSLDNSEKANTLNPVNEMAVETYSPDKALERKQRSIRVRKAINALPEAKKTMIVLRDIEGLSYEEIADITG
ncbi:MAG: sigma-70 family RNA polymerase sigma factor, partial [Desulfobacterales bacterium]|nr:sigma-70 family RNA polymerase sigma factor [Desulfobacterales bacterium]